MAVSSLKCCFSKLSTKIRDYLENSEFHQTGSSTSNHSPSNGIESADSDSDQQDQDRERQEQQQQPPPQPQEQQQHSSRTRSSASNRSRNNQHSANNNSTTDTNQSQSRNPSSNSSRRHGNQGPKCASCAKAARRAHQSGSASNQQQERACSTSRDQAGCRACEHAAAATTSTSPPKPRHPPLLAYTKSSGMIPVSRAILPRGFKKKVTAEGQVFFIDARGNKYWYDPSLPKELIMARIDLDLVIGKLSKNWEIRQTVTGKTYFVNHFKKTTQFTDPRMVAYRDYLMEYLNRKKCGDPHLHTIRMIHILGRQPYPPNSQTNNLHSSVQTESQATRPMVPNQDSTNRCSSLCPFQQANRQRNDSGTEGDHCRPGEGCCAPNINKTNICYSTASIRSSRRRDTDNGTTTTTTQQTRHGPRERRPDEISLGGSHQNLNSDLSDTRIHSIRRSRDTHNTLLGSGILRTNNRSNTLTGPIPEWLRRNTTVSSFNQRRRTSHQFHRESEEDDDHNPPQQSNNNSSFRNGIPPISANNTIISNYDFQHSQQQYTPRGNKELFDKISILRQELLKQQIMNHPCRIDINRRKIFEESFRVISQMQSRDLKKRLLVKFRGEEGLDYGGVAREWFYLLSREILNPVHGLFQYTSDDIYNLQINPDSGIVYREHLSYLNFCGRVIGMAVFHGHFIEGHFTLPFYKMLLKKPINLNDIEHVDPELHRSLCWMLENNITDVIDTTFSIEHDAFGQLQEHELKENGKNIPVTEENKHEYVSLYVNHRCRRGIESQFEALQRGFYELVPASLIELFDEYELELLIGGLSKIDISDWRLFTKLKNCDISTPLVKWFWDIVYSYDEAKRARLLQFVTGSPRVPIQGFKALQGVNSELRLFTIHLIRNANTDDLPKSHTCFNRIDLPPYETYEKLRDKLTQAIEETMGFAMQ